MLQLFKERDPALTLDAIEKVTLELSQIATILQETYQIGREAEQAEGGCRSVRDGIAERAAPQAGTVAHAGDNAWFELWISAWAEALSALRWSRCDEIVALANPASPGGDLGRDLKAVSVCWTVSAPCRAARDREPPRPGGCPGGYGY